MAIRIAILKWISTRIRNKIVLKISWISSGWCVLFIFNSSVRSVLGYYQSVYWTTNMALPVVLSIVGNSKVNETHAQSFQRTAVCQVSCERHGVLAVEVQRRELVLSGPLGFCLRQEWGDTRVPVPAETSSPYHSIIHCKPLKRPGPKVIITNTVWSSLYMPALSARHILTHSFQHSWEAWVHY